MILGYLGEPLGLKIFEFFFSMPWCKLRGFTTCYTLHHIIIILFSNSFISILCQWFMSLKYEIALLIFMWICWHCSRNCLKGSINDNAKGENREMHLYLTCKNKHDGVFWYYSWYSIPSLLLPTHFFCFIDQELYKIV